LTRVTNSIDYWCIMNSNEHVDSARTYLTMPHLARQLGVGAQATRKMVKNGMPTYLGRRTTVSRAIEWLEAHPELHILPKGASPCPEAVSGQTSGSAGKCG